MTKVPRLNLALFVAIACVSWLGLATVCWAHGFHVRDGQADGTSDTLFYDGFEEAADNGWKVGINDMNESRRKESLSQLEQQKGSPISLTTSPVREGHKAIKFTVQHQLGQFRSEIARAGVPMNSDCWYGFSIYLPSDWQVDPQSNILAQWHALIGQKKTETDNIKDNPPLSIAVVGSRWIVKMHWSSNSNSAAGGGNKGFDLGPIHTGVWVDYVVHAKWSYAPDGIVQIWQNGKQLVDHQGPNEYNNRVGPYFKIGIYHPEWKLKSADKFAADTAATKPIVVFHDAVRIAISSNASYNSVAPRDQAH